MTDRLLIVNADDLALHPAVNQGIFAAHAAGLLRSASMLATGPAAAEVVAYVRDHPALDVGVHLTLLDVPPAGDLAPWQDLLDDEGRFPPSVRRRSLARLLPRLTARPGQVLDEFDAQIRRLCDLGLRPTHADSHNHLHLWPTLLPRVARLCADHGIPWLRIPRAPVRRWPRRPWEVDRAVIKGSAIRALGRAVSLRLPPGLRTADHFVGLGLYGPGAGPERARRLARALGPGVTEWLVHPVHPSPAFRDEYPWGTAWGSELDTLRDASVHDELERAGVRVVGFGALP